MDMIRNNHSVPNWIRSTTLLLIVLGVLGPFLPSIQTSFGTLFPFRLMLPIYILVLAIAISRYGMYHVRIPRITTVLFIFLILGASRTLLTIPTGINISGLIVLSAQLSLLFGIILTLTTRRWVYLGWLVLLVLAVLSFGVASIEIFTGWHWSGSMLVELPDVPRYSNWVTAWYHNVNDFSFFALIATIPALVMALNPATNNRTRMFFAVLWITGFTITFQIYSRATMLAYPLVVISTVVLVRSRALRTFLSRIPVRAGEVILPSIGIGLAGILYAIPNPVNNVGTSLWTRWQLQKAAILEGGIIGQGLGNAAAIIGSSSITTGDLASPHSWYGAVVSETGMLGLVLFLIFYGGLLAKLVRMTDMNDPVQMMSVIALGVLPVAGLGPSNVLRRPTWWIVIGLAISTCIYSSSSPIE